MTSLTPRTRRPSRTFKPVAAALLLALALPAQPPTPPQYTIRVRVPLTIVDVTVTDDKGRPVHNLKQSDFTLLEDNHSMQFQSFDEHRTDIAAPTPALIQPALPPNTFTNTVPAARNPAPPAMLVIDNLNTPAQAQQQVTQRLLDFSRKMPHGTQMAVFLLTTHLAIVQGFTSDPTLIEAALNDKRVTAQESAIADPNSAAAGEHTEVQGNQNSMRGQYTLTAMHQIARYAAGIPGRKNLVWFSGAFPTTFPPAQDLYAFPPDFCPLNQQVVCLEPTIYDFAADVKYITDLLARAHVTVYPIDARGIQIPDPPVSDPRSTTGMTNRMNLRVAEHGTMDTFAEDTGGKAVYNSNDFAGAVQDAIENGSNYYTITYAPANQALDTRFRTITVRVSQPGLHLTYRNGYYAVAPDIDANGHKIETVAPMQSAMIRGTLPATQILFRVKLTESPASTTLAADNQPDPKQMKPPYRHYSVSYLIDVHGIAFAPGDDGNYRGNFEYGVRVYNADGDEIVNATSKAVKPILVPAIFQSMLQTGANAHRDIDVPATGNYFLRIAVHDLTSDRVGSIEIPTSSITP